jgi:cysteine synthase A
MPIKAAKNIIDLVGNTPLVRLNQVVPEDSQVYAKLEFYNPGSSVKDRIGMSMILEAEKAGKLNPGTTIIEPTSGNTGIALAWVCAIKKYRLILTMPETMSSERRKMLVALGAEIILTPAEQGMKGSIEKASELAGKFEDVFIPSQFENPANPEIHRQTTAQEIWNDTDGQIDVFVAGVGTGGTITGVGEVLKKNKPSVKIIAVEPESSAVLSGEPAGPHIIMGIGAGFLPNVLNTEIIDEIMKVSDQDAAAMTKRMVREEGIICGLSSGAAVHAATQLVRQAAFHEKVFVVIIPDTGERYLSLALYDN